MKTAIDCLETTVSAFRDIKYLARVYIKKKKDIKTTIDSLEVFFLKKKYIYIYKKKKSKPRQMVSPSLFLKKKYFYKKKKKRHQNRARWSLRLFPTCASSLAAVSAVSWSRRR